MASTVALHISEPSATEAQASGFRLRGCRDPVEKNYVRARGFNDLHKGEAKFMNLRAVLF